MPDPLFLFQSYPINVIVDESLPQGVIMACDRARERMEENIFQILTHKVCAWCDDRGFVESLGGRIVDCGGVYNPNVQRVTFEMMPWAARRGCMDWEPETLP